jgi:glycosyltransferase involved in cell wall biosynthesis
VRILVLTNVVPYPPHGGVQLRVLNLLARIARKHEVTLGCHAWSDEDRENAGALSRFGIEAVPATLAPGSWRHAIPAAYSTIAGRPPEIVQYHSPVLRSLAGRGSFDIVQVEESLLAPYADAVDRRSKTKTIIVFHNVHFVHTARIATIERLGWRRAWRRVNARMMRRYEPRIAERFSRAIVVSEPDRVLLSNARPGLRIDLVPNGVDTNALLPFAHPAGNPAIVFVGTLGYRPCTDGAMWLVREVLPRLRQHVASLEVWICGRNAPPEVEALAGPGVFVESPVADVQPYYERATVAVAPLRAGGGSRLNILEAMSLGRAVVSTTLGAEGLDVRHGEHLLLADDPASFADAVLLALKDDELRVALARNARRLVEDQYDWDGIADRQMEIYDELLAAG